MSDKSGKESFHALFSQEFLRNLESLSILARQMARGTYRADRRSLFRGESPEFAEYRAYVAGDDTRYIDWNAYARWRHLVIKLFVEEHDLPVYLLLDCSASMDWGSPVKFDFARQLVAGLMYIGLNNHDRVGVIPLGKSDNDPYPAQRGKDRFWRALHLLADYKVHREDTVLEEEVRQWLTTKPQRGMVIWISDLWGCHTRDAFLALDRLRYSRHEIAVIQLFDAEEGEAGTVGEYHLNPVEGHATRSVIVDQRTRREYTTRFMDYQKAVVDYSRQHRIPLLQSDTTQSVPDLLIRVLREKGFIG